MSAALLSAELPLRAPPLSPLWTASVCQSPPPQRTPRPPRAEVISSDDAAAEEDAAALTATASALELFELCRPARDATVACVDLESVLQQRCGPFPSPWDGSWNVGLFGAHGESGDGSSARKRVDFLTFWRSISGFLGESPMLHARVFSTIRGLQCFGDGVLQMCRKPSRAATLPSQELIRLLQEVRDNAADPVYWDEVIAAVPDDRRLRLSLQEVAEAVYVWLKDCIRAESEVSESDSTHPSGSPTPFSGLTGASTDSILRSSPAAHRAFSAWAGSSPLTGASPHEAGDELPDHHDEDMDLMDERRPRSDGSALGLQELKQANEAAELIRSWAGPEDSHVREAVRRLLSAHEALGHVLQSREAQVRELQDSLEVYKVEASSLHDELAARHQSPRASTGKCVLCLDGATSHAAIPCGHLAFCGVCAAERPTTSCPVCRRPTDCLIRIFEP
mmetsp:Transcript_12218/g.22934  ORF Transcript_12218/g.22934 Transcript_12218/m.22934 type:complete len:450 (-) Transcript_12218:127-1476(-)